MKQDCEHYNDCRKPVSQCNGKCPEYRRAEWAVIKRMKVKK